MRKTILIILTILFLNINAYCLDTLRHFKVTDKYIENIFLQNEIYGYGERFEIENEFILEKIKFKVFNENITNGKLIIYSNNGGNDIVNDNSDIIFSKDFKEVPIDNWIDIEVQEYIKNNNQIFVTFELENNKIITSDYKVSPTCSSEFTEYYNQIIKIGDEWLKSTGVFLIELVGSNILNEYNKNFKELEFEPFKSKINNIIIEDVNNDNNYDIITNEYVLLNKGNNIFDKDYNYLDTNKLVYSILFENNHRNIKFLSFGEDTINNVSLCSYDKQNNNLEIIEYYLELEPKNIRSYWVDKKIINLLVEQETHSEHIKLKILEEEINISERIKIPQTSKIIKADDGQYKYLLIDGTLIDKEQIDNNLKIENEQIITDMKVHRDMGKGLRVKNFINLNDLKKENIVINFDNEEYLYNTQNNLLFTPIIIDFDNNGNLELFLTSLCSCRGSELLAIKDNTIEDITYENELNGKGYGPNGMKFDINNDGKMDLILNRYGKLSILLNESLNDNSSIIIRDKDNSIKKIKSYVNGKEKIIRSDNFGYLVNKSSEFHVGTGEDDYIDSLHIQTEDNVLSAYNLKTNQIFNDYNDIMLNEVSQNNNQLTDIDVSAYPNPFENTLNFSININSLLSNNIEIKLFDSKGSQVLSKELEINNIGNYSWTFKVNNKITSGSYIYEVHFGHINKIGSLIKK